jgi:hypothetical protein
MLKKSTDTVFKAGLAGAEAGAEAEAESSKGVVMTGGGTRRSRDIVAGLEYIGSSNMSGISQGTKKDIQRHLGHCGSKASSRCLRAACCPLIASLLAIKRYILP